MAPIVQIYLRNSIAFPPHLLVKNRNLSSPLGLL